jgi:DNA invertase Pin-like site-specific DNA recombinase
VVQEAALREAVAAKVYSERVSGVVTDRAALKKALRMLGAGNVLLMTRLDRLARSTRDLLNVLDAIGKAGLDFGRWRTHGLTPQPRTGG